MRSVDALCFEERPDYAGMRYLLTEEVRAEDEAAEDGEDEVFVNLEIRDSIQLNFNRMFNRVFNRAQDTL